QVDSVQRTSLRYVERTVRSNQLEGEHLLDDRNKVDWSLTSSAVKRVEPDRADIAYGYEFTPGGVRLPLSWLGFIPEAAKRTSGTLTEDALNADLSYTLTFGSAQNASTFKVGGAYRRTDRD